MFEEYASTFAFWGSVSMLPFFACPLIACWYMIKCGFSDFFPPAAFIDGLVSTILFYQYAKFQNWPDLVQATLFGIVLGTIYLLVYYYYLWDKTKFNDSVVKWGWFVALVLVYANWQSSASQYFEYILAGLNYSSLIYPFMGVKYVYQAKCTFGIPYPIIFAGQVVCTFWLLFAISVHNYLLMVQLLISFILGAIQIVFYFVYPTIPNFTWPTQPPTPCQQQPDTKKTS